MVIRKTMKTDLDDILYVEREAFREPDEAELTRILLGDITAEPRLSLLAFEDEKAVAHILFTRVVIDGKFDDTKASILAPLAVLPDWQGRGIGGRLIRKGLQILEADGIELVFVLGHPGYYPKHGFAPAGRHGLNPPYPIPEKDSDAWMVQELRFGAIDSVSGIVRCADGMNKEEYWRE